MSLLSCIADLKESQNVDQSLTSPLNFGKTSLGSRGFDGATETGGGKSCDSVGGGRDPLETVEGGTPPPVGVDARNNSIFCRQSMRVAIRD